MLKVLHVQKVTGICGSENHLLELAPRLDRNRYDVTFLVLEEPGRPMDEYLDKLGAAGVKGARMTAKSDFSPGLLFNLWRFIKRGGYDLVHTHLIHADLYAAAAARLAGAALVSSKHGCNDFRRGVIGALDRLCAVMADRVVAISWAVKSFYERAEGIPSHKWEVIHYGITPPRVNRARGAELRRSLKVSGGCRVLLNVARLVPFKAQAVLLDALAELLREGAEVQLWLAGDGPLANKLKARAESLGITGRVRFLGFRRDVADLLCAADIFVFPSVGEGFGLALLEAMACGLPVIASRATSLPEIVAEGETGLLVEGGDHQGLARAAKRLLEDPALARRMGEAGARRAREKFAPEVMARRMESLYEKIVAKRNACHGTD